MQSLKPLLNLFLKQNCPLCERSAEGVFCRDCLRRVQHCQVDNVSRFWQEPLPLFPWGIYGGALKQAIAALKYDKQRAVACPLGHGLGQAWLKEAIASPPLTVIPIPLHADKQAQRGFNQAALLADAFCQVSRLPMCPEGLVRVRATEAQFSLSGGARLKNLADAFQVSDGLLRRPPRGSVLLLDDIFTTGATVQAAAQCLRQHQITVFGVVAIAVSVKDGGT